jgi:hypothetical protein
MFELIVEPIPGKNPGLMLDGPYVTENVWRVFNRMINSNSMTCPLYHARQRAGAFFQGGSNDPNGRFVFIEFWQSDYGEFVRLANQSCNNGPIISRLTEIHINLYAYPEAGSLDLCVMIAEEANCPYDAGGWGTPFHFKPESSVSYNKVMTLVRTFGLTVVTL